MKTTAQPTTATSQEFTQILDIREHVVLLRHNNASAVIEVSAVNFALLSPDEQDGMVNAYGSFLNSLSFPVEILVYSKKIELFPYITLLQDSYVQASNVQLKEYIKKHKEFVESLIQQKAILDKRCYMVVSYSILEANTKTSIASSLSSKAIDIDTLFSQAKIALQTKIDTLMDQFNRLNLRAKLLQQQELVSLFYEIYNAGENSFSLPHTPTGTTLFSAPSKGAVA